MTDDATNERRYADGGIVPAPSIPVTLAVTECIISAESAKDRTFRCSRLDLPHLTAVHAGEPFQHATFGMPDLSDERVRQHLREGIRAIMGDEETQQ